MVHPFSSDRGEKVVAKLAFVKATQIPFQICVKMMDLFRITTHFRATHRLLQDYLQQQREHNINSADVWRRLKAAKGTAPRPPTHHMPQEEA